MSSLKSRAMLVNITIHAWAARKQDKTATTDVEQKHGASDAGYFNKRLIDKSALLPISREVGRIRDFHYSRTLPWGENGERLLPSKMYFSYTKEIRDLIASFDALVEKFVHNYPALVNAARSRLGTLYEAKEYPDVSHIRTKFGVEMFFTPVPDAADFRVDIAAADVDQIRQDITAQVMKRQEAAVKDLWGRLHDVVSKIYERLHQPDAVFRDSLIENARDTAKLMEKLNLTEDPEITKIADDVLYQLCSVPQQRLREDLKARENVANAAAKILERIPN